MRVSTGLVGVLFMASAGNAFAQNLIVNEFLRSGNLTTTTEWMEILVTANLTAAQLEGYEYGDSTTTTAAKEGRYQFTNMSGIAPVFLAGTLIVVGGTTAVTEDTGYDPLNGDWEIRLRTTGSHVTANGNSGDFAATDVAWVDLATGGSATITDGSAIHWGAATGALGAGADVTVAAPVNNTGVVFQGTPDNLGDSGSYASSITTENLTPGQPNGGSNTGYINGLRTMPVCTWWIY